ncbi:uncharacterized protein BDZ99DRAFT_569806 [Mytilinidion resinicola]|uniref:Uncharacterized protein n=1 Tax=Mytilinidion resinicola TaxID=574789 RepID=A0A6A6YTZ3_9PEZI|nr:uncharacterized protein BDZ99DRAFT_569806 [Mytilinidion resinicola]KAF2811853.1 hypothetical protein BDZ99DRAFT_569806 [Mytilinidion resinicola]
MKDDNPKSVQTIADLREDIQILTEERDSARRSTQQARTAAGADMKSAMEGFNKLIDEKEQPRRTLSKGKSDLVEQNETAQARVSDLEERIRELEKKRADAITSLTAEKNRLAFEKDEIAAELIAKLDAEIRHLTAEKEKLTSEKDAIAAELNQTRSELEEDAAKIAGFETEVHSLTADNEKLVFERDDLATKLTQARADHEEKVAELSKKAQQWHQAYQTVARESRELDKEKEGPQSTTTDLQAKNAELKIQINSLTADKNELTPEKDDTVRAVTQERHDLTVRVDELLKIEQELVNANETLTMELQRLESEGQRNHTTAGNPEANASSRVMVQTKVHEARDILKEVDGLRAVERSYHRIPRLAQSYDRDRRLPEFTTEHAWYLEHILQNTITELVECLQDEALAATLGAELTEDLSKLIEDLGRTLGAAIDDIASWYRERLARNKAKNMNGNISREAWQEMVQDMKAEKEKFVQVYCVPNEGTNVLDRISIKPPPHPMNPNDANKDAVDWERVPTKEAILKEIDMNPNGLMHFSELLEKFGIEPNTPEAFAINDRAKEVATRWRNGVAFGRHMRGAYFILKDDHKDAEKDNEEPGKGDEDVKKDQ